MISLINNLSFFLLYAAYDMTFIFIAKHLFEDSIKIDKLTVALAAADTVLSAVIASLNTDSPVLTGIGTATSWGTLAMAVGRGERKKILKRLRAAIESFLVFGMSIQLYCILVFALMSPDFEFDPSLEFTEHYSYSIYQLIICIIFFVYLYNQLVKKNICLNLGWKTRAFLISFSLFIMLFSIEVAEESNLQLSEVHHMIKTFIAISVSLIYIVVPAFLIRDRTSTLFETGQKHHQEMLELETKHFRQYKNAQEETRRFRHDILNNLLTVQTLQREGKNKEASDYINELLGQVHELSPKVVTGSDMLDSIMTSKIETMEQSGINYDIDGIFDQGLNMKSVDMCTVFANAMDNAIEACVNTDGERSFEMRIKRTSSFYVVAMKNTMSEADTHKSLIGTSRFTTKKNKAFHGYGLDSIKKTVEKYGGETKVSIENNMFLLNIILPVA